MSEQLRNEQVTINGESDKPKKSLVRRIAPTVGLVAGVAAFTGVMMGPMYMRSSSNQHRYEVEIPQIEGEMAEDGFDVATGRWGKPAVETVTYRDGGPNYFDVTVDFGNCEQTFEAQTDRDDQDNNTDVHSYRLGGFAANGVLTFENRQELEELFGTDQICEAIARGQLPNPFVQR